MRENIVNVKMQQIFEACNRDPAASFHQRAVLNNFIKVYKNNSRSTEERIFSTVEMNSNELFEYNRHKTRYKYELQGAIINEILRMEQGVHGSRVYEQASEINLKIVEFIRFLDGRGSDDDPENSIGPVVLLILTCILFLSIPVVGFVVGDDKPSSKAICGGLTGFFALCACLCCLNLRNTCKNTREYKNLLEELAALPLDNVDVIVMNSSIFTALPPSPSSPPSGDESSFSIMLD